jgi:hypothetical protein
MNLQSFEMEDSRGVKWSASRDYDGSYTCYKNGMSAFDLTLDRDVWEVRNNAPHADTYKNRNEYLRALANVYHRSPVLGVSYKQNIVEVFEWAVNVYKKKGWVIKDCFGPSMATKPAYPRLNQYQLEAVKSVLDHNWTIKRTANKYACSPSTVRRWLDKYTETYA